MAKALFGKAPLTVCRSQTGGYVQVYAGQPAPGDITKDDAERLLEEDYLEEREVAAAVDDDSDGPPAKSAAKGDWVAFAVSQGMSEEDANAATKDQLVEQYS